MWETIFCVMKHTEPFFVTSWVFKNHFHGSWQVLENKFKSINNFSFFGSSSKYSKNDWLLFKLLYWWKNLQNSYEYVEHPFFVKFQNIHPHALKLQNIHPHALKLQNIHPHALKLYNGLFINNLYFDPVSLVLLIISLWT